MEDPDQIHQISHQDERPGGPNDIDHPHGKRSPGSMKRGDGSVEDAFPEAQDQSLEEFPADELSGDLSPADGRIIEAGEGGTEGGPDEADEAIMSPVTPEGRRVD